MSSSPLHVRQWWYMKRPVGRVSSDCYELRSTELNTTFLPPGFVLLKVKYWSVDPYMRIEQAERDGYDPPHPLQSLQQGSTVAQVLSSSSSFFSPGDWALCNLGWQTAGSCHESELRKIDHDRAPVSTALGVLGMPGRFAPPAPSLLLSESFSCRDQRTAWFGLMEAGRPRPGETLVVSGAAGAVGSLVVQFGKKAGCRVVAIAGGPAKCTMCRELFGADFAVDYRQFSTSESLRAEVERLVGTWDIYFDNVGGYITDALLPLMNLRARVVICGAIAQYESGLDHPELDLAPRFLQHLIFKRATIQGILARDFKHRQDEMEALVAPWVKKGEIKVQETLVEGFDQLPRALAMLFEGGNTGKLVVAAKSTD